MIGLLVLAVVIIVWPLSSLLTMIIHDIIIGKEGREAEREESKRQAELDAQLARNSKEMQDRVDEIFRKQREEMGRRQKEREMREKASNNGPTNNAT